MLLVPHLSGGGGERIAADLSCNLRADETVLVVFERRFDYPFRGRVVSLELPIRRESILSRVVGFVRRAHRFRQVLRQEKPDVVISFMGEANILNSLLAHRPVVTVHNHLSSFSEVTYSTSGNRAARLRNRFEATLRRLLISALFRRARVIAVAETVRQELIEHFGLPENQVIVVSNAVDNREIQTRSTERANCPWTEESPAVITVGRLTAAKGQWHLIRAFAESRKRISCQLVIAGTGELEPYLRQLVKELGIENSVFFLGWQENPYKFMARADLFVLPSLSEAFGLVLLEAMACGLPVIAADCPGDVRGILSPGTIPTASMGMPEYAKYGVLVSAFDREMPDGTAPCTPAETQLADAIVRLLTDESLRASYASAGKSRVRDFDHQRFVDEYQKVLSGAAKVRD